MTKFPIGLFVLFVLSGSHAAPYETAAAAFYAARIERGLRNAGSPRGNFASD